MHESNKFGVFVEGSALYNLRYKEPEYQFGLNFYFPLSKNIISISDE